MPHIPHLRVEKFRNMFGECRNISAWVVHYNQRGHVVSQHRLGGAHQDNHTKLWITSVTPEDDRVLELGDLPDIEAVELAFHNAFDAEYAAQLEIVRDVMDAA